MSNPPIRLRRGTQAQWDTANPILADGEIGLETDTQRFKIGDGSHHWSDRQYFENLSSASPKLQAAVANAVALAGAQVTLAQTQRNQAEAFKNQAVTAASNAQTSASNSASSAAAAAASASQAAGVVSGNAGGALTGQYPNPTLASNAVNSLSQIAIALRDGAAANPTLRSLGTGTLQAAAGSHLHDDRYYTQSQVTALIAASQEHIGKVSMHWGTKAQIPSTHLAMDGSTFVATDYPLLNAYLGTNVTPDMRDRFPIGVSSTRSMNATGGQASRSIDSNHLPSHNHGINDPGHVHGQTSTPPGGGYMTNSYGNNTNLALAVGTYNYNTTTGYTGISTQYSGGGGAFDIMNPWRALWFIIRAK